MPGEPKETNNSILYSYFKAFASIDSLKEVEIMFSEGKGWGELKKELFILINTELEIFRNKYLYYLENPKTVESILIDGEKQVIAIAEKKLVEIRKKIGIRSLDEK